MHRAQEISQLTPEDIDRVAELPEKLLSKVSTDLILDPESQEAYKELRFVWRRTLSDAKLAEYFGKMDSAIEMLAMAHVKEPNIS